MDSPDTRERPMAVFPELNSRVVAETLLSYGVGPSLEGVRGQTVWAPGTFENEVESIILAQEMQHGTLREEVAKDFAALQEEGPHLYHVMVGGLDAGFFGNRRGEEVREGIAAVLRAYRRQFPALTTKLRDVPGQTALDTLRESIGERPSFSDPLSQHAHYLIARLGNHNGANHVFETEGRITGARTMERMLRLNWEILGNPGGIVRFPGRQASR